MRKPLVSIVTICYNEKYIERTCVSIVKQTFQDFEWIVIDGGSTDKTTLSVLKKYKDRMDIFVSERDSGRYNAMNKGIKKAKGSWIIFMNGGDSFYNYDVLKDVFYHKKYRGIDILYGLCNRYVNAYQYFYQLPSILDFDFISGRSLPHQSTFFRRQLFKKYGYYEESYQIVSDWIKVIEYLKNHCSFLYLGMIISTCNMEGISSQGFIGNFKKERNQIIEKISSKDLRDNYLDDLIITITSRISIKTRLRKKIVNLIRDLKRKIYRKNFK